jgi:hypothetical protein
MNTQKKVTIQKPFNVAAMIKKHRLSVSWHQVTASRWRVTVWHTHSNEFTRNSLSAAVKAWVQWHDGH